MSRILWVATADARGHLMRCQLLAHALRAAGHEVEVLTTSRAGQQFLEAFGVASAILSEHYRVEFDQRQNMARWGTEWRMFRYLTSPLRFARDLAWLSRTAQGASLVVNDSFHPALLVSPHFRAWAPLPAVLHVYGGNLRTAMEANFDGRWPASLARVYRTFTSTCADGAFARIQHSLEAPTSGRELGHRSFAVPPVLAAPGRPASEVRLALGLKTGERLAVVYLNPHFRDLLIAEALEQAARAQKLRLYAVGEGYAGRPGWLPWDTHLVDAVSAADLFVSTPGMAGLGLTLSLGIPFVALMTDQPEQRRNAEVLQDRRHPHRNVEVGGGALGGRLEEAMAGLLAVRASRRMAPSPSSSVQTWVELIGRLALEAESRVQPLERRLGKGRAA